MKKIIAVSLISFVVFLSGCSSDGFTYCEGTSLTLGLYLPVNGTVYGLQCLNYLSGKRYSGNTNVCIRTSHSLTNGGWGVSNVSYQDTDIR